MSKVIRRSCAVCGVTKLFKSDLDFADHLRTFHSTKEGGSFICRYGAHCICPSLPLEGVSSHDYEEHIQREHIQSTTNPLPSYSGHSRNNSDVSSVAPQQPQLVMENNSNSWTVYSSTQNLPAVLNDPRKSRREVMNFFTRHHGESFIEKTEIHLNASLPRIGRKDFETYLASNERRFRRHLRDEKRIRNRLKSSSLSPRNANDIQPSFEPVKPNLTAIPKIFCDPKFRLEDESVFNAVFFSENFQLSTVTVPPPSTSNPFGTSVEPDDITNPFLNDETPILRFDTRKTRILQEKLTHYLDNVESQISHQVAAQSPAFFRAMASHDHLQTCLSQTKASVKVLRDKCQHLDRVIVEKSTRLLRLQCGRRNRNLLAGKLEIMAAVRDTQANVQSCLAHGEYMAALEMIASTQEVLQLELGGVACFRHLSSQLSDVVKAMSTKLQDQFVCYIQTELNRPTYGDQLVSVDELNLSNLVLPLLRIGDFRVIGVLQKEIQNSIKTLVRQIVQTSVSNCKAAVPDDSVLNLADQMRKLSFDEWMELLGNATTSSINFCRKLKIVQEKILEFVDVVVEKSGDQQKSNDISSGFIELNIGDAEYTSLRESVLDLTWHTCSFAQERIARVIAARSKDGFLERLTVEQFALFNECVENYVVECELICGKRITTLRSTLVSQASKFVARFHEDKKTKLGLILDNEYWKQADVPVRFQSMVDYIQMTGRLRKPPTQDPTEKKPLEFLTVGQERFIVIGTSLLFLEMIIDYCQCVEDIPVTASELLHRLEDLLRTFNSRTCQLILGAGALQLVGLKTISTRNLALSSRCLQLIASYIPVVQQHFSVFLPEKQAYLTKHFNTVLEDYRHHVDEIFNKLFSIVDASLTSFLRKYEAKPPSPNPLVQQICKQIKKFYENVAPVLPEDQIQVLFQKVHSAFKEKFSQEVRNLNIIATNDNTLYKLVSTDFSFYMESVRSLPCCASYSETLADVLVDR